MDQRLVIVIFFAAMYSGCYDANTKEKPAAKRKPFVYKETIVKGNDTGMIRLGGFKRLNIADILCQRWQLENGKGINSVTLPAWETRESIVSDVVLFKDSTVVSNPMGTIKPGTWQISTGNKMKILMLQFQDGTKQQYILRDLASNRMKLAMPESASYILEFSASGQLHQNMRNDPFHPANNQWRVKPVQSENNSAIHARIKNCLLFYALYYRDHIKRNAETISFEGLPSLFKWYNGGIGLPDKDDLADSWIECFYNKKEALKGYSILRKLIVDYEFNWPKGTPGWIYRTHAVLEQMYHKVDDLKTQ